MNGRMKGRRDREVEMRKGFSPGGRGSHRLLWLLCLLSLCVGLAGCRQRKEESFPAPEISESGPAEKTDMDRLVVTYQTLPTSVLRDLEEITAAVNEITREEIGVEIEFRLVDETDAPTRYPLWISKNERIDLMMLSGQDITTYVSRGMLEPLDELLEREGGDIRKLSEEGIYVTEGAVVKGQTYGAAPVPELPVNGYGLWAPASLVAQTGLDYDESHIYTLAELTGFFARCKELYPKSFPLGQITSGRSSTTFAWYGGETDQASGASSFTFTEEDGSVVSFYETEEYRNFLEYLRRWYQEGYIYPDAAFTDAYLEELVSNGLVLVCPGSSSPGYEMEQLFEEEAVCLRTSPVTVEGQSRIGFWTIPVTSKNPEGAMKFLNLMYRDVRITNLIQYGIASRHYVVLDVESGRISYPYGVSRRSTGYYNPLGLYGDRRKAYTFDTKELVARKQAYMEEALERQEEPEAFYFETDQVNLELAAVRKVVEKYVPVLESGSLGEEYYTEFIMELHLAGIDRIVAERQQQYDAWREGHKP